MNLIKNNDKKLLLFIIGLIILFLSVILIGKIIYDLKPRDKTIEAVNSVFTHQESNIDIDNDYFSANNFKKEEEIVLSFLADEKKETIIKYDVEINILENSFKYQEEGKAVMYISFIDPEGKEVTSLDGFEYTQGKGFNITEFKGLITLIRNQQIKNASKTEATTLRWKLIVYYDNDPVQTEEIDPDQNQPDETEDNNLDKNKFEAKINIVQR